MYAGTITLQDLTHMTIGVNHVVTEQINGTSSKLGIDDNSYVTANAGTNNPGGATLGAIGGGGSTFSNVLFFGGTHIGRLLNDAEIAACRTYFGARAGLSL